MGFVNPKMETLEKNFYAERINEICKARKCNCKELASECGIPYSTFQRYASGNSEPRAELFLALHQFGINLDWFVAGEGEMYRANRPDQVRQDVAINYAKDSNVVTTGVNNGHIVAGVRESHNDQGGRGLRLCQFARWWMDTQTPDRQAWMEVQIERAVPEYGEWKKGQGM